MEIRDRIKELRRVRASELVPHDENWREHPEEQQDALRGAIEEIGYADALLCRELPDGRLQVIDGHMRRDLTPDADVPVLVLDLDEAEARKLLVTFDPLAAMAETNQDTLGKLLHDVETESEGLQAMLEGLAAESAEGPVKLKELPTQNPPAMTWVLLGIPTVRFGEIAETIDGLSRVDGILLETTANDG